jgi:hypothetical protein
MHTAKVVARAGATSSGWWRAFQSLLTRMRSARRTVPSASTSASAAPTMRSLPSAAPHVHMTRSGWVAGLVAAVASATTHAHAHAHAHARSGKERGDCRWRVVAAAAVDTRQGTHRWRRSQCDGSQRAPRGAQRRRRPRPATSLRPTDDPRFAVNRRHTVTTAPARHVGLAYRCPSRPQGAPRRRRRSVQTRSPWTE